VRDDTHALLSSASHQTLEKPGRVCDWPFVIEPAQKPVRPTATPTEVPPSVFVFSDVLDELRFNASWRPDRIGGGLLAGQRFIDPNTQQAYVEVRGFLAGTHVVDVGEFGRYLRVQWKAATAGLHYHFKDAEILGWYMGVPDGDRRPGPEEVALHEAFFDHSWQRALWIPSTRSPVALRISGGTYEPEPVGIIGARAEDDDAAAG
jgi:hypothetical protein